MRWDGSGADAELLCNHTHAGTVRLARAITRELLGYVAQQMRLNLQSINALPRSRSPQELLIVQGNFVKATSENILEAASSIFRIASQMAAEVGRERPRMGLA